MLIPLTGDVVYFRRILIHIDIITQNFIIIKVICSAHHVVCNIYLYVDV